MDPDLAARIADQIQRAQVEAHWLRLEFTESATMSDAKRTTRTLARLRGIGVGLSVDDFGTGYSSLAQLQRLPVDEMKVDRSFVAGMATVQNSESIVRAALELGHSLKLACVAEGVENEQTAKLLTTMACDAIQGYYISPPLGEARLWEWITEWKGIDAKAA